MVFWDTLYPKGSVVFILLAQSTPTKPSSGLAFSEEAGWVSCGSFAVIHGTRAGLTLSPTSNFTIEEMEMSETEGGSIPSNGGTPTLIPHCQHLLLYSVDHDGKHHIVHPPVTPEAARVNYDPSAMACQLCHGRCLFQKGTEA